jgi:hypothetical protein
LTQQSQRFQDRQVIDGEMFGLYKSQIDADFSLYKGQRDNYDALKAQIDELKTQVAVGAAIRPYQDKLIQCEIERAFTAGINYVDKKTCNVIYGVTCLPNEPTTTGLVGRNSNGCLPCGLLKRLVLLLNNITNLLKNKLCYLLINLYLDIGLTTTTKEMNIEVTMNIIEDMMMMNVCFLCECSE